MATPDGGTAGEVPAEAGTDATTTPATGARSRIARAVSAGAAGVAGLRHAPRRLLVGVAFAAVVVVVASAAMAKVVNPDLAVLPPVIREPRNLAAPPVTSAPALVVSTTPTPSPTRPRPSQAIRPPAASPAPFLQSYEAEAADRDGTDTRSVPGASGGWVVGDIDQPGNRVRFSVSVPSAGRYTVTFFYVTSRTRSAAIMINSSEPISRSFAPTGSWDAVKSLSFTFDLNSGTNSIVFAYTGRNPAPDLDRLTVGR